MAERHQPPPESSDSGDGIDLAKTLPRMPGHSRDPLIGQVIGGRYQIIDLIGSGGMGAVYRAVHVLMQKVVAIKVLNPEMIEHPEARARFEREAKAAARIAHRNVCTATDFGSTEEGRFFLVMEYMEGESLEAVIARSAPIEPRRVLALADQICQALARAHDLGIVHRDLKPENILLIEEEGEEVIKILDFGIAKMTGDGIRDEPALTQAGAIYGTPRYMAPEQILSPNIDHRADLYSLGVILYAMLTGNLPFDAPQSAEILKMHLSAEPMSLRAMAPTAEIPPRLNRAVLKLLSKKPDDRFASAALVREELAQIASELKQRSYAPGFWESIARKMESWPRAVRIMLFLVLVGLGIGGLVFGVSKAGLLDWADLESRAREYFIHAERPLFSVLRSKKLSPKDRALRQSQLTQEIARFEALPELRSAMAAFQAKNYKEAQSLLETLRPTLGANAFLEYELGRTHAAAENWDESIRHYEFAVWKDDRFVEMKTLVDHVVSMLPYKGTTEAAQRMIKQYIGDRAGAALADMATSHRWPWIRHLAAGLLSDTKALDLLSSPQKELIALRTARTCEERLKHLKNLKDQNARETLSFLKGLIDRKDCGRPARVCYGCLEEELTKLISTWEGAPDGSNETGKAVIPSRP